MTTEKRVVPTIEHTTRRKGGSNDTNLQKEASKEVRSGQLIVASDTTPQPFNSREAICGASITSTFSLGHIPKLRDLKPTCNNNTHQSVKNI